MIGVPAPARHVPRVVERARELVAGAFSACDYLHDGGARRRRILVLIPPLAKHLGLAAARTVLAALAGLAHAVAGRRRCGGLVLAERAHAERRALPVAGRCRADRFIR